jgi:hypothetical protein
MNPIDHPHGGGERPHLRAAVTRSPRGGSPTKGKKTRKNKVTASSSSPAATRGRRRSKDEHHDAFRLEGPFVDGYLLKKADCARSSGRTR